MRSFKMIYTIIGIERVNYTSKKTGKPVLGYAFHCEYEDNKVDGCACCREYIADSYFSTNSVPSLGDKVEFLYNRFGNVDSFRYV